MANSYGGAYPRAINARRERPSVGYEKFELGPALTKVKTEWTSQVTGVVRDNGDLTLEAGIESDTLTSATGGSRPSAARELSGSRRCSFDTAGRKRLLIKIAPIERI